MFAQAIHASIEGMLNVALKHDANAQQRLSALQGKVIHIAVQEIPLPLIIRFHRQEVQLHSAEFVDVDAKVCFSIFDAPLLTDAADATHAIQQGKIKLKGDPILLQQAAQVFTELEIDWETLLAAQIGDVPAYILAKRIRSAHDPDRFRKAQSRVQELLVDELEIAASQVEFEAMKLQLQALEAKITRVEKRMTDELKRARESRAGH